MGNNVLALKREDFLSSYRCSARSDGL